MMMINKNKVVQAQPPHSRGKCCFRSLLAISAFIALSWLVVSRLNPFSGGDLESYLAADEDNSFGHWFTDDDGVSSSSDADIPVIGAENLYESDFYTMRESPNEEKAAECKLNIDGCRSKVETNIFKRLKRRPLCSNQLKSGRLRAAQSCEQCIPRKRKVICDVHEQFSALPGLSCDSAGVKEFTIEEYDYATQFDCLQALQRRALRGEKTRIPRIGHAVYFYNGSSVMMFHQHLSILSVVRYLRPVLIFFWNDGLPSGRWFSELLLRLRSRRAEWLGVEDGSYAVQFVSVFRRRPTDIYELPILRVEHSSDVARLEALLLFGGVYLDFDSFAVNRLDPLLNESFVMGYETDAHLTDAVMLGEQNASFALLYHCEYADFNPHGWIEHSVLRPHTLAVRCPQFIRREKSSLCQPANFGLSKGMELLYGENVYFDLSKNYAVHAFMWTFKKASSLNPGWILTMNHTMGRIWRSIYYVLPLEHNLPLNPSVASLH